MNAILILAAFAAQTQSRPPTLDPTYGFPVPPISTAVPKGKPDAQWIWASEAKDNQTVYLKRSFMVAGAPHKAELFVTADDYFTAYLNGQEIGGTHAVKGDDLVWSKVRQYDLSKTLHEGPNVLAFVGRNVGSFAGVLARLEVDGQPAVLSGPDWLASEAKPEENWLLASGGGPDWSPATVIGPAASDPWGSQLKGWPVELNPIPSYLAHVQIAPVRWANVIHGIDDLEWHEFAGKSGRLSATKPTEWPANRPWSVIVDFGEELTGRVEVMTQSFVPSIVAQNRPTGIGTGESIGEAIQKPYTNIPLDSKRSDASSPYTALRYATLTFSSSDSNAQALVALIHLYYPVKYAGAFDCSDPLLTKIWYTGAYTAHLCMQQDIWDAPKRDRARWMGDLHVSGEVINDVFLDKFLMEQTMRRLRADAQGGQPPDKLPRTHVNSIPGYSCAWIAGLADFYRHTGDLDYLKSQHQGLVSMLEYMRGEIGGNGIFANNYKQWPFVDWAPEFNGDTPQARAATHLFYVKAVREGVFLLRALGDTDTAQTNQGWADLLTLAAQEKLVSVSGTFGDRRQENAMAIYSGVANPDQRKQIFDQIFRKDSPAWKYQATPYYDNYVIYAMSMAGHTPEALDFVRQYWGGMLAEGATSFWEGYDPSWDKNNAHVHLRADNGEGYFVSLCHGWSAGATSWLTERVLGIRSTGAGFATCEIQPELADLKWVSGTVPTPHGPITVRVDRTGDHLRAQVAVPKGVVATVRLPGHVPVEVSGGNLVLRS